MLIMTAISLANDEILEVSGSFQLKSIWPKLCMINLAEWPLETTVVIPNILRLSVVFIYFLQCVISR